MSDTGRGLHSDKTDTIFTSPRVRGTTFFSQGLGSPHPQVLLFVDPFFFVVHNKIRKLEC